MNVEEALNRLGITVRSLLATEESPTPETIRSVIEQMRAAFPMVTDDHAESLAREIEEKRDVTMTLGPVVQEDFQEWLSEAKKRIDPYYWERYSDLLAHPDFMDFPRQVVAKIDEATDRTLGLLENPEKEGPWDRRGMVVGHVQSGKTANYAGLVCKAADAGYRLIIVIAGIHNNLRNQTQKRVDQGFIGRDSGKQLADDTSSVVGVGRFDNRRRPASLTSSTRDFNKAEAGTNAFRLKDLAEPTVLVIKKNSNTLKNLINWLKEHNAAGASKIIDAPMLLIDDEADNASIDVNKSPEESSKINSQLRELLSLFNRRCYVGYTATPFANIFIDPESANEMLGDDLFPRDFIVGLDAPSNYLGASRVFGPDEGEQFVRHIDDHETLLPLKHKNGFHVDGIPPSLEDAVRAFVVAGAIRILRGQGNKHHSMLVNASRFTSVQDELRNVIHGFLARIKQRVRIEGRKSPATALVDDEIAGLHRVWKIEYGHLEESWSKVQSVLYEAVAPVEVIAINSQSAGSLDYEKYEENGLAVIAVGGFSLSRGLTLEGLTVSYFLRNSVMYDTLLQMGRWFGYRPKYEDLCRVFMTPEAEGWYQHISESIEELREELRDMERDNKTPKDFGLKVRSHPASLIVTARNKMGTGVKVPVRVGLSNRFVETSILSSRSLDRDSNRRALIHLVTEAQSLSEPKRENDNFIWSNVPASLALDFLGAFRNHAASIQTQTEPIQHYIRDRQADELSLWDVALISKTQTKNESVPTEEIAGLSVGLQDRTIGSDSDADSIVVGSKRRVGDASMEAIGLDPKVVARLKESYSENNKAVPGLAYRQKRARPLLILHALRMLKAKDDSKEDAQQEPVFEKSVVAWGISFPATKYDEDEVEYVVNLTWWEEEFGGEQASDDED